MPRGHEHDPIYSHLASASFSGSFFQFSLKKIVMKKKIVVPCLDVMMIAFLTKNIH